MLVVTVILAYLASQQWHSMDNQWHTMDKQLQIMEKASEENRALIEYAKEQVEFAKKQSDIANSSLDATIKNFEREQRAWVGPLKVEPPEYEDGDKKVYVKEGKPLRYDVQITNSGKTPAFRLNGGASMIILDKGKGIDPDNLGFLLQSVKVLLPGATGKIQPSYLDKYIEATMHLQPAVVSMSTSNMTLTGISQTSSNTDKTQIPSEAIAKTSSNMGKTQAPFDTKANTSSVQVNAQPSPDIRTRIAYHKASKADVDDLNRGLKILYIYGTLNYDDVSQRHHYTKFCIYLLSDLTGFTACDKNNDAN